jgi:hypothetical protein
MKVRVRVRVRVSVRDGFSDVLALGVAVRSTGSVGPWENGGVGSKFPVRFVFGGLSEDEGAKGVS